MGSRKVILVGAVPRTQVRAARARAANKRNSNGRGSQGAGERSERKGRPSYGRGWVLLHDSRSASTTCLIFT